MYFDIPTWLSIAFIVGGLAALAWSSDCFVDGAAAMARLLGISPLIIGMVIIGFGTCAPEFFVSLFSGIGGHSNLSLGNAYGSCIFNIVGVLGVAALVAPIVVKPTLIRVGVPLTLAVTVMSWFIVGDNSLSRKEALTLLAIFAVVMPAYCYYDQKNKGEENTLDEAEGKGVGEGISKWRIGFDLVVGLAVMVGASHLLVWGSVDIARVMGVSELVIGLTIVAIGTSVPELATAIASARKGESDLVLGNVVGSNLFNILCVVGTAGAFSPTGNFSRYVIIRDLPVLMLVTISLLIFGRKKGKQAIEGCLSRKVGALWVIVFLIYLALTIYQET